MGSIAGLITAIEQALSTVPGLEGKTYPDTVNIPSAWVDPTSVEIEHNANFDGDVTVRLDVSVAVAALSTGLALAVRKAWPYMGTSGSQSVTLALENNAALALEADSVAVSLVNRLTTLTSGGIEYVGFKVSLEAFLSVEEGE